MIRLAAIPTSTSNRTDTVTAPVADALDRDVVLARAEAAIRKIYGQELSATRMSVKKALLIGKRLAALKEPMPHGAWSKWVDVRLPFDERSAQKYMFLHRHRHLIPKTESGSVLALNATCKIVARLVREMKGLESGSQTAVPKKTSREPRLLRRHSEAGDGELLLVELTPQQAEQVLAFLRDLGVDGAAYQILRGHGDILKLTGRLQDKISPYLNAFAGDTQEEKP